MRLLALPPSLAVHGRPGRLCRADPADQARTEACSSAHLHAAASALRLADRDAGRQGLARLADDAGRLDIYRQDGRGSHRAVRRRAARMRVLTLALRTAPPTRLHPPRQGIAAAPVALTIRTSTMLPAPSSKRRADRRHVPPYVAVAPSRAIALLDATGFSRGRFVVEQAGDAAPGRDSAWAEIERVTEDCRSATGQRPGLARF